MLAQVVVSNPQGDLLTLPLDDISSGIIVEEIDGLDPVKATLTSTSFAGIDGEQFQNASRDTRNITMQLGMDPDPSVGTVQDVRRRLYGFFMPESPVGLSFIMDDGTPFNTTGYVETFVAPLFAQEPVANLSIICYDPDFYDPTPTVITGNTTSGTDTIDIPYDGTSKAGFVLTLSPTSSLSEFTVYYTPAGGATQTLDFVAPLAAGDVLTLSTVPGSKGATLVSGGTSSSVLYGVSSQATWIMLTPGDASIRVYAEGSAQPFTLSYTSKYGGL